MKNLTKQELLQFIQIVNKLNPHYKNFTARDLQLMAMDAHNIKTTKKNNN